MVYYEYTIDRNGQVISCFDHVEFVGLNYLHLKANGDDD